MQIAVCQMTEAEYNRTVDIVGLLIKTMDNATKRIQTVDKAPLLRGFAIVRTAFLI